MIPTATRSVLMAWAKWGHTQNLGYPSLSPMFGERALKTPLFASTYAPPDVLEMDQAIGQIEPDERRMLIHRYLWHMTLSELGQRWAISKWKARHRLEEAEYAAHVAYCARNMLERPKIQLASVSIAPGAIIHVQ